MIWLYVGLLLVGLVCVAFFVFGLCRSASESDRMFEDRRGL